MGDEMPEYVKMESQICYMSFFVGGERMRRCVLGQVKREAGGV